MGECDPISGDNIERTVTWGGESDLSGLRRRRVRFYHAPGEALLAQDRLARSVAMPTLKSEDNVGCFSQLHEPVFVVEHQLFRDSVSV